MTNDPYRGGAGRPPPRRRLDLEAAIVHAGVQAGKLVFHWLPPTFWSYWLFLCEGTIWPMPVFTEVVVLAAVTAIFWIAGHGVFRSVPFLLRVLPWIRKRARQAHKRPVWRSEE